MKSIEVPYSKTLTKAMPLATRHLIKCVPAPDPVPRVALTHHCSRLPPASAFLCEVHVQQLQLDELYAVLSAVKASELSEAKAIQRLSVRRIGRGWRSTPEPHWCWRSTWGGDP